MDNEDEGARLTRREENRELIAKHRATVEPKGCPTPGSCSAVAEIADLKQRLLPQANGRAERAEKARQMAVVERDEMLEQLIVRRTAIANLHEEINGMRGAAPVEVAQTSEEIDVLGKYDNEPCGEGITLRRQWWSGGTWLEKGDRVVVLRPRMKQQPTGCIQIVEF